MGLIELLIALTILVVGIAATTAVFTSSLMDLRHSSKEGTAITLADRQLESYRAMPFNCLPTTTSWTAPAGCLTPSGFPNPYSGSQTTTSSESPDHRIYRRDDRAVQSDGRHPAGHGTVTQSGSTTAMATETSYFSSNGTSGDRLGRAPVEPAQQLQPSQRHPRHAVLLARSRELAEQQPLDRAPEQLRPRDPPARRRPAVDRPLELPRSAVKRAERRVDGARVAGERRGRARRAGPRSPRLRATPRRSTRTSRRPRPDRSARRRRRRGARARRRCASPAGVAEGDDPAELRGRRARARAPHTSGRGTRAGAAPPPPRRRRPR